MTEKTKYQTLNLYPFLCDKTNYNPNSQNRHFTNPRRQLGQFVFGGDSGKMELIINLKFYCNKLVYDLDSKSRPDENL